MVKAEELANFPWTSLRFFGHMDCPEFLGGETILAESGGLADTTAGGRNDRGCLAAMAAEHPRKRDEKFGRLSNGWLAARLAMGQPATVSQYARRFQLAKRSAEAKFQAALSRISRDPFRLA